MTIVSCLLKYGINFAWHCGGSIYLVTYAELKWEYFKFNLFFLGNTVEDANLIVRSLAELIVTTKMKVSIDMSIMVSSNYRKMSSFNLFNHFISDCL